MKETKTGIKGWHNFYIDAGWSKTTVASVKSLKNEFMKGRTIADLADEAGQDPFEFAYDLLLAEDGAVFAVYEFMARQIMEMFLSLPFAMVGSDGAPVGSKPHPRLYGTFPRVIRMAREKGLFSLEQAVMKMTSQPNQRLGIVQRGLAKPGYWADLTPFDPEIFSDTATYDNPRKYPVGLKMVLVNGRVVIKDGKHTGERAGEFLFPER